MAPTLHTQASDVQVISQVTRPLHSYQLSEGTFWGITSITILLSVNTEPLGYVKQTQIRVAELLGSIFVLKSKDTETRDNSVCP